MKKSILTAGIAILLVAASIFGTLSLTSKPTLAYVDLQKVMEEFDMYKEYQERLNVFMKKDQALLDSMKAALLVAEDMSNDEKQYRYGETAQAMKERYSKSAKDLNDEVLQKLNIYMKEYSKNQHLDFLFGAEGSGVIMAANEDLNLTTEAIEFINKKYQGKDE